jgi:hypothetical protein
MIDNGSTVDYKGYKLPAHLARDLELFEFLLEDAKLTRAQIESAISAAKPEPYQREPIIGPGPHGDYT